MEEKNVEPIISENQFIELLTVAKNNEPAAILELLNLFNPDIQKLSRYIYLPPEDAASEFITEFLEFIKNER